jgi:hypothetical protein
VRGGFTLGRARYSCWRRRYLEASTADLDMAIRLQPSGLPASSNRTAGSPRTSRSCPGTRADSRPAYRRSRPEGAGNGTWMGRSAALLGHEHLCSATTSRDSLSCCISSSEASAPTSARSQGHSLVRIRLAAQSVYQAVSDAKAEGGAERVRSRPGGSSAARPARACLTDSRWPVGHGVDHGDAACADG